MSGPSHPYVSQIDLSFPALVSTKDPRPGRDPAKVKPMRIISPPASGDLLAAIEAFQLNRQIGGCTKATMRIRQHNLGRFAKIMSTAGITTLADASALIVQRYLAGLRERMKPISVHQHYRDLHAFFCWAVDAGLLDTNPTRGLRMKVPRALPYVPEDAVVARLLAVCDGTYEGIRNHAVISLLADSALRISEAFFTRIEDANFATRTILVHSGKGQQDGVSHFGVETATALRAWLRLRPEARPGDWLFTDRRGRSLSGNYGTHLLHRLSVRAGLQRRVGPHALRRYATTSILRQTGDLELVRQILRHSSLAMTLVYARLVPADVSRKFHRASPIDNLRASR